MESVSSLRFLGRAMSDADERHERDDSEECEDAVEECDHNDDTEDWLESEEDEDVREVLDHGFVDGSLGSLVQNELNA